ncbi:MAG: DnaA/Hda family protein [Spirochaetia bacterium]|nr:DnaA/Hda family protein [Spirochaetia bacterium]
MEDVWKTALKELKNELPEDFFNPFIKPLKPIAPKENSSTFILGVEDKKIISHLNENYKKPIQTKLKSLMGREVTVDFQELPDEDTELEITDQNKLYGEFSFDNFIISPTNEMALIACKSLLEKKKPSHLLFLSGKTGTGKTHLIKSTAGELFCQNHQIKIYYSNSVEFKEHYLNSLAQKKTIQLKDYLKNFDVLILEDIQLLGKYSESTQEEFFYLFNHFFENGKTIILSSDRSISEVRISDRLKSRFLSGLTAEIQPPDFNLKCNIIKKKNIDLNLDLSEKMVQYLANSISENIRILESALKMLSFLKNKHIDINHQPTVQTHLKSLLKPGELIPIDEIVDLVCRTYSVSKQDLLGKSRKAEIALPRHLAMFLALKLSGYNKSSIARYFQKSDHTIVINAEKKIKRLSEKDSGFYSQIEDCMEKLWKNRV